MNAKDLNLDLDLVETYELLQDEDPTDPRLDEAKALYESALSRLTSFHEVERQKRLEEERLTRAAEEAADRIRAEERRIAAEKQAAEQARVRALYDTWKHHESAILDHLINKGQAATVTHQDPRVRARELFEDQLGVPAPPIELWTMTTPTMAEVLIFNGNLLAMVDLNPGLDDHLIQFQSATGDGIQIPGGWANSYNMARLLVEYPPFYQSLRDA